MPVDFSVWIRDKKVQIINKGDSLVDSLKLRAPASRRLYVITSKIYNGNPIIIPADAVRPIYPPDSPAPNEGIFNITNSGSGWYVINEDSNPVLNLTEGQTYTFIISAPGHPFWIKTTLSTSSSNAYNSGITNNGTDNGTLIFTVPYDAPSLLYYNCQFHSSMAGSINIIDVPITPAPEPAPAPAPAPVEFVPFEAPSIPEDNSDIIITDVLTALNVGNLNTLTNSEGIDIIDSSLGIPIFDIYYTETKTFPYNVVGFSPNTVYRVVGLFDRDAVEIPEEGTFNITNSGSGWYIVNGTTNATLNLTEGQTYTFTVNTPGHPFWIKTTLSTSVYESYNSGITNNGTDDGTLTFIVPYDAPSRLYYNCRDHSSMAGIINIIDAIAPVTPVVPEEPTGPTGPDDGYGSGATGPDNGSSGNPGDSTQPNTSGPTTPVEYEIIDAYVQQSDNQYTISDEFGQPILYGGSMVYTTSPIPTFPFFTYGYALDGTQFAGAQYNILGFSTTVDPNEYKIKSGQGIAAGDYLLTDLNGVRVNDGSSGTFYKSIIKWDGTVPFPFLAYGYSIYNERNNSILYNIVGLFTETAVGVYKLKQPYAGEINVYNLVDYSGQQILQGNEVVIFTHGQDETFPVSKTYASTDYQITGFYTEEIFNTRIKFPAISPNVYELVNLNGEYILDIESNRVSVSWNGLDQFPLQRTPTNGYNVVIYGIVDIYFVIVPGNYKLKQNIASTEFTLVDIDGEQISDEAILVVNTIDPFPKLLTEKLNLSKKYNIISLYTQTYGDYRITQLTGTTYKLISPDGEKDILDIFTNNLEPVTITWNGDDEFPIVRQSISGYTALLYNIIGEFIYENTIVYDETVPLVSGGEETGPISTTGFAFDVLFPDTEPIESVLIDTTGLTFNTPFLQTDSVETVEPQVYTGLQLPPFQIGGDANLSGPEINNDIGNEVTALVGGFTLSILTNSNDWTVVY